LTQVRPLHGDADDLTGELSIAGAHCARAAERATFCLGPVLGSSATGADLDRGSNEWIMEDLDLDQSLLDTASVSAGWVKYGMITKDRGFR
jgi:hypothetical protein